MNAPTLPDTSSLSNKVADLADEAGEFAQDHLVGPARDFLRSSRRRLSEAAHAVTDRLGDRAEEAAAMLHDRRDRTAHWISTNPFAAIAAAAGAGVLLTLLLRRRF